MSIPLEQVPQDTSPELSEWLMRMLIQVSASFEELEEQNLKLSERLEQLESKQP